MPYDNDSVNVLFYIMNENIMKPLDRMHDDDNNRIVLS